MAIATAPAAHRFLVVSVDVTRAQVMPDGVEGFQQLSAEGGGIIHLKGPVIVLEDAKWRRPLLLLLYQQAIGCQLQDMGRLGLGGCYT
jgi:hypothetical protein